MKLLPYGKLETEGHKNSIRTVVIAVMRCFTPCSRNHLGDFSMILCVADDFTAVFKSWARLVAESIQPAKLSTAPTTEREIRHIQA
jgi:hypothetical protein